MGIDEAGQESGGTEIEDFFAGEGREVGSKANGDDFCSFHPDRAMAERGRGDGDNDIGQIQHRIPMEDFRAKIAIRALRAMKRMNYF